MNRTCPKCGTALAFAARGTLECAACAGRFIPGALVSFLDAEDDAAATASQDYDAKGGQCPVDHTILSRAEIDLGGEHAAVHLERCSSCRGVWFDRGEWALLAERHLLDNLDQIWTAEWRARQRRARSEREYERRQREELGDALHAEILALATKLRGHARRSQALAFLREASAD